MGRNRRRQYIVDESLQRHIITQHMWGPCLCLIATSSLLGWYCWNLKEEALLVDADLSIAPLFLTAIVFVFSALGFSAFVGLRLSAQIAGPMVNFGNTLKRVREGDLSARIQLRKGDLLFNASDHVNQLLDWLEEHPPTGVVKQAAAQARPPVDDVAPPRAATPDVPAATAASATEAE